jgi:integrase
MKITIEKHAGRLRLRWVHKDKRYTMSCGVNDDPMGHAVAKQKAAQIELDIQAGYFDLTLLKYKPRSLGKTATEITTVELFQKFTQHQFKEKGLAPRSLETRYIPLQRNLEKFLNIPAHKVTESATGNFVALLLEQVSNQTAKARLWLLQSCWEWAKGRYQVAEANPWSSHIQRIKPTQSKRVKPFTSTEILMILDAFKKDRYYCHYYPLVYFLFGTGCRFGEAVGLRWKNVADDFSHVFFCESISRGHQRNTTKTGKSRTVVISPVISAMLRSQSEKPHKPDDLVFPSPKGKTINDRYFNRRAWKTIISQIGIEYRKPYATRHSAISHALANGANYVAVAEATGHNPKVMHEHYASSINQQSVFVEF